LPLFVFKGISGLIRAIKRTQRSGESRRAKNQPKDAQKRQILPKMAKNQH